MRYITRSVSAPRNVHKKPEAFTLIELLAVMAVLAVLVGLVVGGVRNVLDKAAQSREVAAGRILIQAYLLHASDHDGNLLVGYYEGSVTQEDQAELNTLRNSLVGSLPTADRGLDDTALHRYPYRLASYFEHRIDGVVRVNKNRRHLAKSYSPGGWAYAYHTSRLPAFGINHYFAGGYKVDGEFSAQQLSDSAFKANHVPKPSSFLIFATAFDATEGDRVEGRHILEPPAYRTELWDENLHVDPRHNGKALCAFLDGSVQTKGIDELRDMRLWSKNAQLNDNPNYRVAAGGSGGIGGGSGGRR